MDEITVNFAQESATNNTCRYKATTKNIAIDTIYIKKIAIADLGLLDTDELEVTIKRAPTTGK